MSDITCCPIDGGDGDNGHAFITKPRAAKPHRCCECDEGIPKGTVHEHYKVLSDGRWDYYRTCASCVEIRDHFACNGWIFEHVWEDLEQNMFPDMKAGGPCFEGLSPAAKGRLFERRLTWLFNRGEY